MTLKTRLPVDFSDTRHATNAEAGLGLIQARPSPTSCAPWENPIHRSTRQRK
jgi:hypothetical protein